MFTRQIASEDHGTNAVRRDGMDARDFAELRTRARATNSDVTATTAEKQNQPAQIELHENLEAPEGQGYAKVRRTRRSFHFE